jgi:ADP-heptose:LPS heptosyltransferase
MKMLDNQADDLNEMRVKFLVIRLSSIGDIVLTTPVIRCLKQQVANAEVHFLIKRQFIPVLKANPNLDGIHEYSGTAAALRLIKDNGFHYIIDLHNNLRTALIKSRSSIIAFSFNKLNIQKWLLVNFKKDVLPDVHIVDRYLDTLKLFDVINDKSGLDYFIPPEDEVEIRDLPELFHKGYILFAVGANHHTKRLPTDKIIAICKLINLPVILAGGPEDTSRGDLIAESGGKSGPECLWKV